MHRAQQAGLADGGDRVGRNDDVGLDRDLHVGVPALDHHAGDTAHDDVTDHHGRIGFQCTDIGEFDVVDRRVSPSSDGAGEW